MDNDEVVLSAPRLRVFALAGQLTYTLCGLIAAVYLSWLALSKVDFGYPWLYQVLEIEQHCNHFGPLNFNRDGFESTTNVERLRLFSEINQGVHQQGQGLGLIMYHGPDGQPIDTLLQPAELIHLQDVANLIDVFKFLGLGASLVWLAMTITARFTPLTLPNLKRQSKVLSGALVTSVAGVLLIGSEIVFYQLHQWVFPAEHQWFFYYEESLMSMLMKAPDLFGAIAILLLLLAVPVFVVVNGAVGRALMIRS